MVNNDVLQHYGILGMKWGVRRSEAQLARVRGKSKDSQENWSDDAKNAAELNRKSSKQMSTEELKRLNERQNLEKQHDNLNPPKPSSLDKGLQVTKSSKELTDSLKKLNESINSSKNTHNKVDLSNMSDKELRDKINRINLERQYSQLTNDQVSKGSDYVNNVLDIAGSVLSVAGSAAALAVAIKSLKG